MMDLRDGSHGRTIGNYILGPKIGSGSFAVVWRGSHRQSGTVVAVKEIDKKQLIHKKIGDNLRKEISILTNIRHPNIIRLFEAIETEERIYLVLEYCDGGDLSAYIHRRGKISEALAKHFMKQLAAGLQVLNENRLIHRDLKPQNLLLSTNEETPLLKIGDFGFARYLAPQGLADTLCGSPLYMAPEIIQNKKYDGKADLWSAGAILFQLVTGKPPFNGNSQLQLFHNILTSNQLQFPEEVLKELNPDCVALCRSLLRRNPVERLTFEEFFNHKFLAEPRLKTDDEKPSVLPKEGPLVLECFSDKKLPLTSDQMAQSHSQRLLSSSKRNPVVGNASVCGDDNYLLNRKEHSSSSRTTPVRGLIPNIACDGLKTSVGGDLDSSNLLRGSDLMQSIEKDYVFVNANFTSMETFTCSLGISAFNNSASGVCGYPPKKNDHNIAAEMQVKEITSPSPSCSNSLGSNVSSSSVSTILREVQSLSMLHPSARVQLLHLYINILSELARGKLNAGLLLESFSVELVVLAIWKEALQISSCLLGSAKDGELPRKCSPKKAIPVQEAAILSQNSGDAVDFSSPQDVSTWAEQGFLVAFDRAEKLSNHIRDMDGNAQMPDAMEIIFQTALEVGKIGGVDELIGNRASAAASYSKAMLLLSFIVGEAMSLPLNPPFFLTLSERKRIEGYIVNFESRHSCFKLSQSSSKQTWTVLPSKHN